MSQEVQFVAPFIVLEGDEGTGKGTVAKDVCAKLEAKGIPYVHTFEPGGTELGLVLRQELLKKREVPLDPVTHILLHQAYRKEHIDNVIMPALLSGKVVVCERFYYSTLALNILPYIKERPELQQLFMDTMPHIASNIPQPITFMLDIVDDSIRQARLAGRDLDAYESRPEEILAATSGAYKMFLGDPQIIGLDGTAAVSDLSDRIVDQIEAQLKMATEGAAEFDAAEAAADDSARSAIQGDPEPEPEFNLEGEVEAFIAENLVAALFNHDESRIAENIPTARAYVLSLWNAANDPTLFVGANRARMRTQMHSIFHFGHQLELLRENMAKEVTPAITPTA